MKTRLDITTGAAMQSTSSDSDIPKSSDWSNANETELLQSKKLKTDDVSEMKLNLFDIDQKLSEAMADFGQCGQSGDDSSDDDVGDTNSAWSEYILSRARKIDELRQRRNEMAQKLLSRGVTVTPIDDGY